MAQTIKCPKCGSEIPLDAAISQRIREEMQAEFEQAGQEREQEFTRKAKDLSAREKQVQESLRSVDDAVAEKLALERGRMEAEAKKKAADAAGLELADLKNQVAEKDNALALAQRKELELRQQQRALEGEKQSLELNVARRREEMQAEFERVGQEREHEFARRATDLAAREKQVKESLKSVDDTVAEKLTLERAKMEVEARQKAADAARVELADLKNQVAEQAKALEQAQRNELDIRKKQRELEAEKSNLELEVTRRLDEERNKVRDDTLKAAEEKHRLKDLDKDKTIADMKTQLADMQRRVEQGSQQAQGEVLELDLELQLKAAFPLDGIEPVPKGTKGADVIQRVSDRSGRSCGTIVWEAKRTKNWGAGWVDKLKQDQRDAKADLAVLLTTALPKGIDTFGQQEGVWVTSYACALGLGAALRDSLIHVAAATVASTGKQDKMELLYNYLAGPDFRRRMEAIVEAFVSLKKELDKEKVAMNGIWAKREKQIERVLASTAGMYGDLQGISGAALPKIENLELKAIADSGSQDDA